MFDYVLHFFWGCCLLSLIALASIGAMFLIKAWTFAIELQFAEFKHKKLINASDKVVEEHLDKSEKAK